MRGRRRRSSGCGGDGQARRDRRQRRRQQGQRRPHRRLCRRRPAMAPVADYLTINISSPNTPGLRGLQDEGALASCSRRWRKRAPSQPVFLKVAPDLEPAATTTGSSGRARPPDRRADRRQHHGVAAAARRVMRRGGRPVRRAAEGAGARALRRSVAPAAARLPLIGVGGIENADDALDRISAGASLVQLYSAMVYDGPGIGRRIAGGLAAC